MGTGRLPARGGWGRGGSSDEQVWTGLQSRPPDVTSRRSLYSEVQCIMGNDHMRPQLVDRMIDRQIGLKTLPSHNYVGGWKKKQ